MFSILKLQSLDVKVYIGHKNFILFFNFDYGLFFLGYLCHRYFS